MGDPAVVRVLRGVLALLVWSAFLRSAQADERLVRDSEYYRGRAHRATIDEVLLWVPRTLAFPLYLVAEHGLRRPVRDLVALVQDQRLLAWAYRITHPVPNFSWTPSLVIDFGVISSGGVRAHWTDVLVRNNQLQLQLAGGHPRLLHLSLQDQIVRGPFETGTRIDFSTRPDRLFYGLGPRSNPTNKSYFTLTRREIWVFLRWFPSAYLLADVSVGHRSEVTSTGLDPSLETRFQVPDEAPGFGSLELLLATANVVLDSRRTHDGGGAWCDISTTFGIDLHMAERRFFVHALDLQGGVEIVSRENLLVGSIYLSDSNALGSEPVPFTHLPALGRLRHHGFQFGRYIGQSAVLAEIEFRHLLFDSIDALLVTSVGNVFGPQFLGFDPVLLTGSIGFGLRTRERNAIVAIVAAGTNRFDQPFGLEGLRLFVGINRGL